MTTDETQSSDSQTLGDRLRSIADTLQEKNQVQIKATARILGAAAQLAQNHDRLIDEVTGIVEQDLDTPPQTIDTSHQLATTLYTVAALKQEFRTLAAAKKHFAIKAKSWKALVEKLNTTSAPSSAVATSPSRQPEQATHLEQHRVEQRLGRIEADIQDMKSSLTLIHTQLNELLSRQ